EAGVSLAATSAAFALANGNAASSDAIASRRADIMACLLMHCLALRVATSHAGSRWRAAWDPRRRAARPRRPAARSEIARTHRAFRFPGDAGSPARHWFRRRG